MAYRSFLPITRDMRMARSLHLEGKTDSEIMYWKYTLSSAFLKLCPSNQVPPSACLSQLQHVPKWSQSGWTEVLQGGSEGFTWLLWSPECPWEEPGWAKVWELVDFRAPRWFGTPGQVHSAQAVIQEGKLLMGSKAEEGADREGYETKEETRE